MPTIVNPYERDPTLQFPYLYPNCILRPRHALPPDDFCLETDSTDRHDWVDRYGWICNACGGWTEPCICGRWLAELYAEAHALGQDVCPDCRYPAPICDCRPSCENCGRFTEDGGCECVAEPVPAYREPQPLVHARMFDGPLPEAI